MMHRVGDLVAKVGTAEGAARVVLDVAQRHQVPAASSWALPRPTRAERARAAAVVELPAEADARRRHPTARPTTSTATRPPTATRRSA